VKDYMVSGKVELKSFDVMSVMKIYAIFGFIGGLIAGLIAAPMSFIASQSPEIVAQGQSWMLTFFGVYSIILFPIVGIVCGLIGGAIFSFLYNIIAGKFGGIKMEFK
jgi:hypothetical protein